MWRLHRWSCGHCEQHLPSGLALDSTGTKLYISEAYVSQYNGISRISVVDLNAGTISAMAGLRSSQWMSGFSGDGGDALAAKINPAQVGVDDQNRLLIPDAVSYHNILSRACSAT